MEPMRFRMFPILTLLIVAGWLPLAGCSLGVGYRIPGTPIGVGASVPLDRIGRSDPDRRVLYRPLYVASQPTGARILINGELVGSTPAEIQVPFTRGRWGRAEGSAQLLLELPGHLPEGVRLFPARDGVAREPEGPPVRELRLQLRHN